MTIQRRSHSRRLPKLLGALLATTAMLCASPGGGLAQPYAPGGAVRDVVADPTGYGGQLALPMGGSQILRFARPIGQVMVGNPKIGDVIPLGERTLYVLGKTAGATSLTVMPRGGGMPLAMLDVRVGYDVDNIRRAMRDMLPGEPLEVSARGDGVVLSGVLSSSAVAARAASLAEQYAPGHVVNLTSLRGAEQVMLSVRVAEVQRSALKQLGLNNISALWDTTRMPPVGSQPEMFLLQPPALNPDAVGNLLGHDRSGDWTITGLFDALEKRGFASTLAEPNLVALSGETAVFFAGGEFPVPVPQTGTNTNTITIEYKQYGVSIGFTPTVFGDSINLAVAPEVSALDPANSVVLQGFRIPGLTTRRAKTTVELRNGQSFAIAGLIRREFSDNLRGIPGSATMPVFGALFRSTGYQNNETEVVIIVTAHLAKPTDRRNLLAPTDLREGPKETDLFLKGTTDRPLPTAPGGSLSRAPQASGAATASAGSAASAKPLTPAKAQPAVAPAPTPVAAAKIAAVTPIAAAR
jgi:pilus assembly protein CpaC